MRLAGPARRQRRASQQRDMRMPAGEAVNDGSRGVDRVIINYRQMQTVLRIVLREQRAKAGADIGFLVARRNDDADAWSAVTVRRGGAIEPGEQAALLKGPRDQPGHHREP